MVISGHIYNQSKSGKDPTHQLMGAGDITDKSVGGAVVIVAYTGDRSYDLLQLFIRWQNAHIMSIY